MHLGQLYSARILVTYDEIENYSSYKYEIIDNHSDNCINIKNIKIIKNQIILMSIICLKKSF